jgi:hypothetical protein
VSQVRTFKASARGAALVSITVFISGTMAHAAGSAALGDNGSAIHVSTRIRPSQADADAAALAGCNSRDNGMDCKIIARFQNQCFAMAWDASNHRNWSWAVRPDKQTAIKDSDSRCLQSATGCNIPVSDCDGSAAVEAAGEEKARKTESIGAQICEDRMSTYLNALNNTCNGDNDCIGSKDNMALLFYQSCFDSVKSGGEPTMPPSVRYTEPTQSAPAQSLENAPTVYPNSDHQSQGTGGF